MVLADLLGDRSRLAALGRRTVDHAARFGWGATAAGVLDVYVDAIAERAEPAAIAVNR